MLKLEIPNITHKNAYEILIKEWSEAEKIPTSPKRLFSGNNFYEFLKIIENDISNNEDWVNAHLYFLIENEEILWAIHLRHDLIIPKFLEMHWHIWYWIAPKHRMKWYAKIMLELVLNEAKNLWLNKVLVSCNIDNIASEKVIQKNWGIFERLTIDGKIKRYWINL